MVSVRMLSSAVRRLRQGQRETGRRVRPARGGKAALLAQDARGGTAGACARAGEQAENLVGAASVRVGKSDEGQPVDQFDHEAR